MRKEVFFVGDLVHVFNRGNRKQEIVRDKKDRWYFIQSLYYFNDSNSVPHIFRELNCILGEHSFYNTLKWPNKFPKRDPLVKIHAAVLKDNHFHLILEEIREGGITEFMRKIGTGMTCRFNTKYNESGKLFQGSYKARRIDKDHYLQYLNVYIHVKNIFEMYPGGFNKAIENFDDAYEFAKKYEYSSLSAYENGYDTKFSEIISTDWLEESFKGGKFKEFAKNCLENVCFNEKTSRVGVDGIL